MRIHLLRFIILGTTALTACSSDQIIMESVTLSDLANTGCETTYSAKESRPEFYAKEKRISPKMTISVQWCGHIPLDQPGIRLYNGKNRCQARPAGKYNKDSDCSL